MRGAVFAAAVAVAVVLGACGFAAPGARDDGDGDSDADGTGPGEVIDTEAADFAAGTLIDGVVMTRGALEPAAFATGLRTRGFTGYPLDADHLVADGITYAALDTALATAPGSVVQGTSYTNPLDPMPDNRPHGVGLRACGECTVLYDGEVYLATGSYPVKVDFDDFGIVEIDAGAPGFRVYSTVNVPRTDTLNVPADGWYPIRIAMRQTGGGAFVKLEVGGQPLVPASQLRARIHATPGVLVQGFRSFGTAAAATLAPSFDHDFALEPDGDLDVGIDRFTLRYSGQLYIATSGLYRFALASPDDYFRLWIDDAPVAVNMLASTPSPMGSVALEPGWHAIVVDDFDLLGDAELHVTMARDDEAPAPVAPELLRPVVTRGLSLPMSTAGDVVVTHDTMTTQTMLPAKAVPDSAIEFIDLNFNISGDASSGVTAQACGDTLPVPIVGGSSSYAALETAPLCAGGVVTAVTVVVDNTQGGGDTTLHSLQAFWSYHGGPDRRPFADAVTFESRILATPRATHLDSLRIDRTPAATPIEVAIRTGETDAEVLAAAWVPVAADGTIPQGAAASERAQYRLRWQTGGWTTSTVEAVTLAFSRSPVH